SAFTRYRLTFLTAKPMIPQVANAPSPRKTKCSLSVATADGSRLAAGLGIISADESASDDPGFSTSAFAGTEGTSAIWSERTLNDTTQVIRTTANTNPVTARHTTMARE